jgi:4-nitrophenyl phosphatase
MQKRRHIIKSFESIIKNYENYIFDCDGVIWRGQEIIDSAVKGINNLFKFNKRVYFLSNTNSISREDLYNKLIKAGVENKFDYTHVYTASYITAKNIEKHHKDIKRIYLIGREGLERELTNVGLIVSGGFRDDHKQFSHEDTDKYHIDESLQAVVCGYDSNISYYKIFYASEVIRRTGKFFGTNYDNRVKIHDKYIPGSYTIISSIETCCEMKAEIVTKPDSRSFEILTNDHGITKDKTLMIGDNPSTDILFANSAGIHSLLVLTGVTADHMLDDLKSEPTYILEDLS